LRTQCDVNFSPVMPCLCFVVASAQRAAGSSARNGYSNPHSWAEIGHPVATLYGMERDKHPALRPLKLPNHTYLLHGAGYSSKS